MRTLLVLALFAPTFALAQDSGLLVRHLRAAQATATAGFDLGLQYPEGATTIDQLEITLRPYDSVGDLITARGFAGERTGRVAGPIEPSGDSVHTYTSRNLWVTRVWDAKEVACVELVSIRAEFADGTSATWRRPSDPELDGDRWDDCPDD